MAEEIKKKFAPKGEAKPEGAGKPADETKPHKKGAAPAPGPAGETTKPTDAAVAVVGSAPTAAELLADDQAGKKIVKAKGAKNISVGIANILATFNNTQVTITDMQGKSE